MDRCRHMLLAHRYVPASLLVAVTTLACSTGSWAEEQSKPPLPTEVQAVVDYLMNEEYPELFADQPYHIRPTGYAVGDLDGDGVSEVAMSFYPHYRQSPTISIFHVSKERNVTRVTEGLAPGPLVPISGDYLDSHTLGTAADFQMDKAAAADPVRRRALVGSFLKRQGNIVEYRNFFHYDGRSGKGTYIDMTNIEDPPQEGTCASFEFSRVDKIEIVYQEGEPGGYLAALVGNSAYLYKINRFHPDGLMDKSLRVIPLGAEKL